MNTLLEVKTMPVIQSEYPEAGHIVPATAYATDAMGTEPH